MNKETRTFIWGMSLLIICGMGLSIDVIQWSNGTFEKESAFEWVLSIGCLLGTIQGMIKVANTTN
jgi:hypothetical protein